MLRKTVRIVGIAALLGMLLSLVAPFAVAQSAPAPQASGPRININTAGVQELVKLPRIGEQIAQKIIDYRSKNGPFKNPEDLMKVSGIGEKIFAQIRGQIVVTASAPPAK